MILGAVGVGGILALLFGVSLVTAPDYRLLYSQLSPASAASMVDALQKAGISTEVSPDGSTVSVPVSDVARARMTLAQKGLPSDGAPGWELFDNVSGLGMDSFMQKIDRLRAMEGELARSIETLDGVQSARVHLVLPDRQAFSTTVPDPSASVIVRAAPGRTVTQQQAMAIRNLIAAAVASMSPDRVTVLSARGDTILGPSGVADGVAGLSGTRSAIEDRLQQSLEQILSARVGAGNARVMVTVELNHSRQQVVSQSFNPDQQVVRSTSTQSEHSQKDQPNAPVGVGANLPPAPAAGAAGAPNGADTNSRSNEATNYDVGNTRSETLTEPGGIKRISVAVLVNGIYDNTGSSKPDYKPRSPQEIAQLTNLVKSAIGFDQTRGDTVSVESLRFMDYSMDLGGQPSESIGQRLANNAVSILRWLIGLAIVALALIFAVRPALKRVFDAPPALPPMPQTEALQGPGAAEGGGATVTRVSADAPPPSAVVASASRTIPTRAAPVRRPLQRNEEADGLFEAIATHGSALKRRVDAVRDFVDADPNEAMKVLRTWLAHEAEAR